MDEKATSYECEFMLSLGFVHVVEFLNLLFRDSEFGFFLVPSFQFAKEM